MNIFNNHNYGDNYVVQAGATVIAGGAKAAVLREKMMREQAEGEPEEENFDTSSIAQWMKRPREERIAIAIQQMRQELCPGKSTHFFGQGAGYQFAYVLALMMNQDDNFDLPKIEGTQDFIDYLTDYVGVSDLPSYDTINRRLGIIGGVYPNWKLMGKKYNDELEAKNVVQRFLSIYLKGIK